jgi:UDP-N-acetylglucosamine acyltransferase
MIGGLSRISKDVPPFTLAKGESRVYAVNVIGLRRAGYTSEQRERIRQAFKILCHSGMSLSHALALLKEQPSSAETACIVEFIESSKRGICAAAPGKNEVEDESS